MFIALLAIAIVGASFFVYPIFRFTQYEGKQRDSMPESFSVRLPMVIDGENYFRIPCSINGNPVSLIVDTKAQSLLREEDIDKHNLEYWGRLPFSAENAYKEKEPIWMYRCDDFKIQGCSFGQPIFKRVGKNNIIHHFIQEGLLGYHILSLCYWKFSVDTQEVLLFGRNDSTTIQSETRGYTKIPFGLIDDRIEITFPDLCQNQHFTLDLGFAGEIEINNVLADSLMKTQPFKTIRTLRANNSVGIVHVFERQTVAWNGITIHNCELINIPDVDGNYLGAMLMHRFNFILAYNNIIKHTKQNHLYISPAKGFETIVAKPYTSKFGFAIESKDGKVCIANIEERGIAGQHGLKLGDEIRSIDRGGFDLMQNNSSDFPLYAADRDSLVVSTADREYTL